MERRIISLMLAVSLLLSVVPVPALATEESQGLCEHHTAHTEECGFTLAVETKECGHVCSDDCQQPVVNCVHEHGDECWQPNTDGGDPILECVHTECTVYSGCVSADFACVHEHGDECWQTSEEGTEPALDCVHTQCTIESGCVTVKKSCNHTHDDACGYSEGRKESPCSYDCQECKQLENAVTLCDHEQDAETCVLCDLDVLIDTLPTYEALGQLEGDDYTAAIAAIGQAQQDYYALTEEQQTQVRNRDKLLMLLNGPKDQPEEIPVKLCAHERDADSCAVCDLEAMIEALPTAAEWLVMGIEEQNTAYTAGQDAADAYNAMPEADQALVENAQKMFDLHQAFNQQIAQGGIVASGTCGDNLTWSLDDTGTMTISGTGAMKDYSVYSNNVPPWASYVGQLTSLVVEEGVTTIGKYAFYGSYVAIYEASSLRSVTIPDSVTSIGESAFYKCYNLKEITFLGSAPNIGSYAFCYDTATAYYPAGDPTWTDSVKQNYGFEGKITWVAYDPDIEGTDEDWTWIEETKTLKYSRPGPMADYSNEAAPWDYLKKDIQAIVVNEGVTSIGAYAFSDCPNLTIVSIPDSVTSIQEGAFANDEKLDIIFLPTDLTELGDGVFQNCSSLESISIPFYVAEIPDRIFQNCVSLTTVSFQSNVPSSIGEYAFANCPNLEALTLPKNATSIGVGAFENTLSETSKLGEVYFQGSAPSFGGDVFVGITANAYYPQDDETWTDSVKQNYGGTITWIAHDYEPHFPCRLSELTPVDYLAFSDLSYISVDNCHVGMTVKQMVGDDKWEQPWKETDIKNSELFGHIYDWVIEDYKENISTGFGAYVFKNINDECVIAYRGSISLGELTAPDWDWWNDWVENDFPMYFGGDGAQAEEAIVFAKTYVEKCGAASVAITGHSLGGGLCDIVSARYGCYAASFNAAPFLKIAYHYYPDEMCRLFTGVENWKFQDHITIGDSNVGEAGKDIKNYIEHSPNPDYNIGQSSYEHKLLSMIQRAESGEITLTKEGTTQTITDGVVADISSFVLIQVPTSIGLGTTTGDRYYGGFISDYVCRDTVYMGSGDDEILTGHRGDILVGGRGNDLLTGKRGNDDYYYYKGDGFDIIKDSSGSDKLHLLGFNSSDVITAEIDPTGDVIHIRCNGSTIVDISTGRELDSVFTINIQTEQGEKTKDITALFWFKNLIQSVRIACPVNVEIIDDATGEVVFTMYDAESNIGVHATDYGYFYIYRDESGELVKEADLFEGYSIRIVGAGTGTMDVSIYETSGDDTMTTLKAVDIPVTASLIATVEEDDTTGKTYLLIDNDNDGTVDDQVQLSEAYQITYDAGDGSGTMSGTIINVGESIALPECTFTAPANAAFKAWEINGVEYAVGSTYTPTADTTVKALWEVKIAIDESNFPDAAFRTYVNDTLDTDADGFLSDSELKAVTQIDVSGKNIGSLMGIAFFAELEELDCGNNQLKTLDVSGNEKLVVLYCNKNLLETLNLGDNSALVFLECDDNMLNDLDVSGCLALTSLGCDNNLLQSLDVSENKLLEFVSCYGNNLTSLDLSANPKAEYLLAMSNSYDIIIGSDRTFDLRSLPGNFDPLKASNWNGGSVSGDILTVDAGITSITYNYDCGNNHTVIFTLTTQADESSYPLLGLTPGQALEIDGVKHIVDENGAIWLKGKQSKIVTSYTTGTSSLSDPNGIAAHQQYPTTMEVWYLTYDEATGSYTREKIDALTNFLTYKGTSIRMIGNQGIRIFTAVPEARRAQLINGTLLNGTPLEGYKLVEYGTLFQFGTLENADLVYDASRNNRSIAYGNGTDAIFSRQNGDIWFTGMLVNLKLDLCDDELVLRPYMVLKNTEGKQLVIYGGTLQRNIGYVAYQNKDYKPTQAAADFIWNIIRTVYGDKVTG